MEALIPEEAVSIAAGDRHSLAVGASGRVWAWGAGGGAGASPGDDSSLLPPARLPRLVPGVASAASVAAGSAHSLILCREDSGNGVICSWGDGSRGALGHAEGAASATGSGFLSFFFSSSRRKGDRGRAAAERAAPRLLRTLSGLDVTAISASGSRSGAVAVAGEGSGSGGSGSGGGGRGVLVWGDDGGFRAAVSGAGRAALDCPTRVPGLDGDQFSVSLLALGRSHALAVREGGSSLFAWGDGGDHGALGLSSDSSPSSSSPSSSSPPPPPTAVYRPLRVTGALDEREGEIKSISAGWKHSLACCDVSAKAAFGRSISSSSSSNQPSSSPRPSSLFSWGWGGSQGSEGPLDPSGTSTGGGQLGTGDDLDRPRPFAVSELVLLKKKNGDGGEQEGEGNRKAARGAFSSSSSSSRVLLSRWRALQVSAGLNHSAALVEVALD